MKYPLFNPPGATAPGLNLKYYDVRNKLHRNYHHPMETAHEICKTMFIQIACQKIKKEIPNLYNSLALDFPNPYAAQCRSTPTHYILVHSAIEYFIKK